MLTNSVFTIIDAKALDQSTDPLNVINAIQFSPDVILSSLDHSNFADRLDSIKKDLPEDVVDMKKEEFLFTLSYNSEGLEEFVGMVYDDDNLDDDDEVDEKVEMPSKNVD